MQDRDLALLLLVLAAASSSTDDEHRGGVLSRVASRATGAVVDILDPNELIGRIDVNAILDRVDIEAFLERVDLNELLDSIDIDALLERIDVKEIIERAGIPDIVRESTGELAGSMFDVFRRQLVALELSDGSERWRQRLQLPIYLGAARQGDSIFFDTSSRTLVAGGGRRTVRGCGRIGDRGRLRRIAGRRDCAYRYPAHGGVYPRARRAPYPAPPRGQHCVGRIS